MITKKSKYAIKALIYLAKQPPKEPILIESISTDERIPRKFLEAILHDLKVSGFVISKKGIRGGYTLDKAPSDIRLADVIRTINGPIALVPCVSLNFYEACTICPDESKCALHHVMIEVRDATLQILESTSLEDLILREKKLVKRKS